MVFAVPTEELLPDGPEASGAVTLRFRVSGVRVGSRTGFWIDTTRTFRLPPRLESGSLITGLLDIPVIPAEYKIRVAIALADSSLGNAIDVSGTTTTWVPSDSLRLSDIVVGGGTDNLLWNGLEGPVSVNAVAAYESRDTVELYYVQGGLQPGAVYRTDLVLTETGEEDALLSLSFEEIAAQTLEDKRRGLALGLLRPGTYQLTVTVTEASSARSVRRQRLLTVN